jgi:hypothetical protein
MLASDFGKSAQFHPAPFEVETPAEAASSLRRNADPRRLPVSRIIWDRSGNPTDYVGDALGITRVSCFWHGSADTRRPSIPRPITDLLKMIPAEIDFDVDDRPNRRTA